MGQWSYTVVSEQGHACEVLWRSRAFRMKRMQGGRPLTADISPNVAWGTNPAKAWAFVEQIIGWP